MKNVGFWHSFGTAEVSRSRPGGLVPKSHFKEKLTIHLVIEIRLQGDIAFDYGWHDLTLTPKDGGQPIRRRDRYVDIWRRNKEGKWKLWMYMDNQDVADTFVPEQAPSAQEQAHERF